MNSTNDEPEIKIEYNASCEIDPLNINKVKYMQKHLPSTVNPSREIVSLSDNKSRYSCMFCHLNYSTFQTLTVHIKTKHPEQAIQIKRKFLKKKRQKQIKCYICKIKFELISDLTNHMSLYHPANIRELFCVYCKALFDSQNETEAHLHVKHGIKSLIFQCNICGYWTLKKSHYNQHLKIHENKQLNQCKFCDYSTSYLSNFNIHQKIHSSVKPYPCEFKNCSYRSSSKSALRTHQFRHNPDQYMVYCDQCNYKTIYKQSLNKHLESHRRNALCD